ncbi:hypothetical protein [Chryseobacterium sp.]|uniref:hypothetical protein n=1 Tax=Chryseobacterium sp. TaxID=1871047 RepID=UPI0011CBCEFE|nr:hypothetical protein [Chryseobacterium sp.]TXF75827.1 hypothetical protein FUA25_07945 [Chryseobacterium sp.]
MKKLILFFAVFTAFAFQAQRITFVSEKTGKPLPKVMIFSNSGELVTTSNIDGSFEKDSLKPFQNEYAMVYENESLGTLQLQDLNKATIKLRDNVIDIEPVVVTNNKADAKYILLKGNFNTYIFLNNKLNSYADGIVTYIFNNKTKKLKDIRIEQYRIFELINSGNNRKVVADWNYKSGLRAPDLKSLSQIDDFRKNKRLTFREVSTSTKDAVEVSAEALQDKELSLFGYRIYDVRTGVDVSFEKDSKKALRDLLEYKKMNTFKLKHKSEPAYNKVTEYQNFYPSDLSYTDSDDVPSVKLNEDRSSYKNAYWNEPGFPNMQTVFANFFKNDLKEVQNNGSK